MIVGDGDTSDWTPRVARSGGAPPNAGSAPVLADEPARRSSPTNPRAGPRRRTRAALILASDRSRLAVGGDLARPTGSLQACREQAALLQHAATVLG
jgi:hypothetical protein